MDKELKAKWVAALRSGKFKQLTPARSYWSRDGMHCCLGVLGAISGRDSLLLSRSEFVDVGIPVSQLNELIGMNDGELPDGKGKCQHRTFPEIADYIEENL